jgi:hypothetical protein
MAAKLNCWEYEKCGREKGGARALELGVCPAVEESRLDGIHGGVNAGRACWAVAGTFCKTPAQGAHALQIHTCVECEFFKLVQETEGEDFHMSVHLREKLYGPAPKPPRRQRKRKPGVPGAPW